MGNCPVKEAEVPWTQDSLITVLSYVAFTLQLESQAEVGFRGVPDLRRSSYEMLRGA
jgi:hypothetical protein